MTDELRQDRSWPGSDRCTPRLRDRSTGQASKASRRKQRRREPKPLLKTCLRLPEPQVSRSGQWRYANLRQGIRVTRGEYGLLLTDHDRAGGPVDRDLCCAQAYQLVVRQGCAAEEV